MGSNAYPYRDELFGTLVAMTPAARKKFLAELPIFYCKGCGGDLQNGICTCGRTVNVTFHRDGSISTQKPKRAR